jgi:drug/metabolite transporter (DMT)-like permease
MSTIVFLAVLGAAFLHAFWNGQIKTGVSKQTSMLILTVGQGGIGLFVAVFRGLPVIEAWPWLIASGVIHMLYQLFLAYAYEQGDLSRVYPIARGAAPMIVVIFSVLFLTDPINGWEYIGIAVLGAGIVLMARGVFGNNESLELLPFALGSACATAGYSLVDGLGARVSGDAITYVTWVFVMSGVFYVPAVLALRGRTVLIADRRAWTVGLVAAAASYFAYAIVVWAMTLAPIAVVTALRETSILFAVLIGWIAFGERMDRGKIAAAILIVLGVLLTRL